MVTTEKFTESEIINRILNGEKALYEIIVRRYNPQLYKIGRSYNYNHEDTQDLMQETFIDAYIGLRKFEKRSGFKTWIIRIMLNNCYRKKEKSSYKNEVPQDIKDNMKPVFSGSERDDTDKIIQNHELKGIIENTIGKIPENFRMVFSLREINGLSVSETADVLNISVSNVKVRLNRAKAMLRTEIEKSYRADELFEYNLKYCNAMVERVMSKI